MSSQPVLVSTSEDTPVPSIAGPQPAWRVAVSDTWDVLGPFPIHAREQHFLSPSYPLDLSKPIDYAKNWPSAYADNGEVGWSNVTSENGTLTVHFPNIRWASLRATEGWAALQHHTVLRTSLTVYPGSRLNQINSLLVDIKQGSFFTILPSHDETTPRSATPKWYAGNIYAMHAAPPQVVPLPTTPSVSEPTKYDLFLSGDYEIRLFGDPAVQNSQVPKLVVNFSVEVPNAGSTFQVMSSHHIVPDFVDGWAFGQHIGIGLRSMNGWWDVQSVNIAPGFPNRNEIQVGLVKETTLAPTQTRIVPIALTQKAAFSGAELDLRIVVRSHNPPYPSQTIPVKVTLNRVLMWDAAPYGNPIIATYMYGTSTPTAFAVIPPKQTSLKNQPPMLVLHGAGVDVLGEIFTVLAPPRHEHSWIIGPTGRTAWGLDWHGPSTQDAWATVEALSSILIRYPHWSPWGFPPDTSVVLVGHSNGGQGTWHIASRYPDRVISAVPAAAYVKSQAYVPLLQSRSAHFIDPALRAILESSLTSDDNDLFLSNLANTPILAVHGGADENVPVWHSRALVDVLKTWNPDANVKFREDPGKPHWYPEVLNNTPVQEFIDETIRDFDEHAGKVQPRKFTLTVAIPSESGSLHGWRVESLLVPGRLARMTVEIREHQILMDSRNTHMFSVSRRAYSRFFEGDAVTVIVDGQQLALPMEKFDASHETIFFVRNQGTWEVRTELKAEQRQIWGRMSLILNSRAPILFVIPDRSDAESLNAALRLAHSLDVYHKLDTIIIDAKEATNMLLQGTLPPNQNIVVLGGTKNAFTKQFLVHSTARFHLRDDTLYLRDQPLSSGSSALFLSPHPTSSTVLVLFIFANDEAGLERALRLFPIRTGVTVPDWIVLSPDADSRGAGGVDAAGVWGVNWSWNEGMSSF